MSELNPFAVNRAEYMRDLWKYYVPLKELDLETSKALVIEGGRGTGKSTVFLCNCWRNQLAAAENDPAKTILIEHHMENMNSIPRLSLQR